MYQTSNTDNSTTISTTSTTNFGTLSNSNNKKQYETISGPLLNQFDDQYYLQEQSGANRRIEELDENNQLLAQQQQQHFFDQTGANYGSNNNNYNPTSFALDEIGEILNSKDFSDLTSQDQSNPIKQTYQQQQQPLCTDQYKLQELQQNCNTYSQVGANFISTNHRQTYETTDYSQARDNYQIIAGEDPIASSSMEGNRGENYNLFATYNNRDESKPYVEIVEQPAKCALRFRYKCEGRSAGSLPGANSTADIKTFPSIRINNYVGRAVVVISCVTKDAPYKAHPHNIVGKEGCKKGICTVVINNEANTVRSFSGLGIQCVKRKDIEESLAQRESIKVDPFRNGFEHKLGASNIDLNVVRLCFQVFVVGSTSNKCDVSLTPVVSDPVHDKKAMSDLVITKLSHCSAPATGGREVILLCDRISKDDIQIRFFENRDGKLIWETFTDLSPNDVHKQVAICFKTPKYYNENITQPVMVRIQLKRISDNQVSEPRLFQFLPCESDEDIISRKRQKIEWANINHYALDNILQPQLRLQPLSHLDPAADNRHQLQPTNQNRPMVALQQQMLTPHQGSTPDGSSPPHHQHLSPAQPSPLLQDDQQQTAATCSRPPSGGSRPITSPSRQEQQQQLNMYMIDPPNLVVRREIIDNEGRVMRLVDRPSSNRDALAPEQQGEQIGNPLNKSPLDSSLDRINTAELMRVVPFTSNMDLNLGLSLSMNGPNEIMHANNQVEHLHPHDQHHLTNSSNATMDKDIVTTCNDNKRGR